MNERMIDVEGWPWLPDKCPADKCFIDYVQERDIRNKTILHVGTGLHHRVGIECCALDNLVIGMTVSREEIISRVFRVNTPNYQVMYGNINNFERNLLPNLDIITLFHYGEMESDFGPVDPEQLFYLGEQLNDSGLMIFYNRSAARDRAETAVNKCVSKGWLSHIETYHDIEIYQKQ